MKDARAMGARDFFGSWAFRFALAVILLAVVVGMLVWEAKVFPQSAGQTILALAIGLAATGLYLAGMAIIGFNTDVTEAHSLFLSYGYAVLALFIIASGGALIICGHQAVVGG